MNKYIHKYDSLQSRVNSTPEKHPRVSQQDPPHTELIKDLNDSKQSHNHNHSFFQVLDSPSKKSIKQPDGNSSQISDPFSTHKKKHQAWYDPANESKATRELMDRQPIRPISDFDVPRDDSNGIKPTKGESTYNTQIDEFDIKCTKRGFANMPASIFDHRLNPSISGFNDKFDHCIRSIISKEVS